MAIGKKYKNFNNFKKIIKQIKNRLKPYSYENTILAKHTEILYTLLKNKI